jgi:hypothetical protein
LYYTFIFGVQIHTTYHQVSILPAGFGGRKSLEEITNTAEKRAECVAVRAKVDIKTDACSRENVYWFHDADEGDALMLV